MNEKIKILIKGGLVGVANIIPGVSGGTIALTLGIYEKLINSISNFFKDIKENIKFLCLIIIGAVIAILLSSNIINYGLDNYPVPTTLIFVGLILGGISSIYQKTEELKDKKNLLYALIAFLLVTSLSFLSSEGTNVYLNNIDLILLIKLFFVGMIAAATMIIPGISGSLVLMMLGFYKPIVEIVSSLTDFSLLSSNLAILIPFGIGIIFGILIISKLIQKLLIKFKDQSYSAILGIIIGSLVIVLKPVFTSYSFSLLELFVGLILTVIGFLIANKFGK